MIAIEDCVKLAVRGFEVNFHGIEERLIETAASVLKKAKKEKTLQHSEKKALHGQYLRQTEEVRSEQSWVWL